MKEHTGLALHWQIVLGMLLGIFVGIIAVLADSTGEEVMGQPVEKNSTKTIVISSQSSKVLRTLKVKSPPTHGELIIDPSPHIGFEPETGVFDFSPTGKVTYRPEKDFTGRDSVDLILTFKDDTNELQTIQFSVLERPFWSGLVIDWIKPFGTIFINLLKLIAIPLIVASLIKGVAELKSLSNLSTLGSRTVVLYLMTTIVAVAIGLLIVNVVKPGNGFSDKTRAALTSDFADDAQKRISAAESQKAKGPLQALIDVVPDNIVGAATANGNMLKVIFFVLFFGVSLLLIEPEYSTPLKQFFTGLNEAVLKMIDIIMWMAPLGVFALLAAQVVTTPSLDVLLGLLKYALCVVAGLAVMVFVFYPVLVVFLGGRSYIDFFRGISPAQLLAFSTSSSAATLPVTMECVEDNLGVRKEVASFVLPIGATVNMDGTSLYQAVAAVFIAQALGVELTLSDQLVIILTATLASIGSAAVPGAGIVMLVIVLGSIGVSEKGIALIFAVDRILDMCRTTVNVTGDATVSLLVNRSQEKRLGQAESLDDDDGG